MKCSLSLFLFLLALGLAGVLVPSEAQAWGPGVHMVTANWLLQNLVVLPAAVAGVIMQHPGSFIHGVLSADIFIGKGSKARKGHSHNWESGFALLEKADTAPRKAYAYGYLCHLAADIVAHNVYVPGLFYTLPARGKTAHIYLEIQADRMISWDSSDALHAFHGENSSKSLSLLRSSMNKQALPFWIHTQIFQGSIAVGGSKVWRSSVRVLDTLLRQHERAALLEYMLVLSTRAMVDVLQKGKNSPMINLDPIGAEALVTAQSTAKRLRSRNLSKKIARGVNRGMLRILGGISGKPRFRLPACRSDFLADLHVPVPSELQALSPVCGKETP